MKNAPDVKFESNTFMTHKSKKPVLFLRGRVKTNPKGLDVIKGNLSVREVSKHAVLLLRTIAG